MYSYELSSGAGTSQLTLTGMNRFVPGDGYHTDHTTGVAVNNEPESIYAVMSGTRQFPGRGCCFDYGNSENSETARNSSDGQLLTLLQHLYIAHRGVLFCPLSKPSLRSRCNGSDLLWYTLEVLRFSHPGPNRHLGNTHWQGNHGDNSTSNGPWVGADLEAGMYYVIICHIPLL